MKKLKQRLSVFLTILFLFGLVPDFRANAAATGIVVDGQKDTAWTTMTPLATSAVPGFQGFDIGNLYLTNDRTSLYFWVDAVNVPNWGDTGQFIDIALNVNGVDSGYAGNPWSNQYNFSGTAQKPNIHIMFRLKQDNQVNWVSVYKYENGQEYKLLESGNLQGAEFAVDRTKGFEGRIPLSVLGLNYNDKLKAIVVLGGNNGEQHGAFDVIPQDPANQIAADWNVSSNPNIESVYSNEYAVTSGPKLNITVDGQKDPLWNSMAPVGTSPDAGWQGFDLGNLYLANDYDNLYFWVDAVNVPNWGDTGQFIDIALNVNGIDSGYDGNPWASQYNFSGTAQKPNIHIMFRVQQDNLINWVSVYKCEDGKSAEILNSGSLNGAEFAVDRTKGLEGKIPLNFLGLGIGDKVKSIVVLSGNNGAEHGAFDVIPQDPGNQIADSWNESSSQNIESVYNSEYVLSEPSQTMEPVLSIQAPDTILAGSSIKLSARYTDENGVESVVAPEWTVVEPKTGITISGDELSASNEALENDIITVQASYQGKTAEKQIRVVKMFTYTINYYRYDGNYTDWNLWLWQTNASGSSYAFNLPSENGYARAQYQFPSNQLNFIVRMGEWADREGSGDRAITVQSGSSVEVWIMQGDNTVYYQAPDLSDKVTSALMDSTTDIYATTSGVIADTDVQTFKLTDADGNNIPVTVTRLAENRVKLVVQDPSVIQVDKLYKVSSSAYAAANVTMRMILDSPQYYYSGNDLGVTYGVDKSTFKLWAPTAVDVSLVLYDNEGTYNEQGMVTDNDSGSLNEMTKAGSGVWQATINGDLKGKYYLYRLEFPDGKTNYAVDPYALSVSANGQRGAIIDPAAANPVGFDIQRPPMIKPTDAIVYEMHVRDFSMSSDSGMTNKGKFMAFTEEGTTLSGSPDIKTGVDHLKELGITHVHLLPLNDYGAVNELAVNDPNSTGRKYNWGYDPVNFNTPEGSYVSDPHDPVARVKEFKELVQSLHKNGIRVIMDVVYNHTYQTGGYPFDAVVPGYYYRTDGEGRYTDGAGCGNEVASERPMVRKYILDSVKYWASEYGVDGFRFDLMGITDTPTMTELTKELKEQVDPSILVYGEPWTGGNTPLPAALQTLKGSQRDKGFAVFNDNFRGAIKGDSDGAGTGFATGSTGNEASIVTGLKGAIDDFTNSPAETINYVTAHDNLNLWDKVLATQYGSTAAMRAALNFPYMERGVLLGDDAAYSSIEEAITAKGSDPYKNIDSNNVLANETVKRGLLANGIIFTSQGIPFIEEGDEFLKSKYGERDSYSSPDIVNKITWQNKKAFKPVFDYYKGLIELRKTHPAFRMDTRAAVESNLVVLKQDGNTVVFELKNYANGDSWNNIVVIYNANSSASEITLPASANWNIVVDNTAAGTSTLRQVSGDKVTVEGLSVMVLYDEAAAGYEQVPTSIDLSKTFVGIETGSSTYITAVVRDQNGRIMPGAAVQWSSDNSAVASVDSRGKVTGLTNGEANITAVCGAASNSTKVAVAHLVPSEVAVNGPDTIYATRTTTLTAQVWDQYNQEVLNPAIQWTSSDTNIAMVNDKGVITGINPGTVTITAKSGSAEGKLNMTVRTNIRRYVNFKYVRPDGDYAGWNIWVWNTGVREGMIEFSEVKADGAYATIEIAPETSRIGFVLRRGTDWSQKDTYSSDRYIDTDLSQVVTKVVVTTGVGEFYTVPPVNGPVLQDGKLTFYYRDDALFMENKMDTLQGVQVKVNEEAPAMMLASSTTYTYDMTYNPTEELYSYTMDLPQEGTFNYTFLVKDANGEVKEVTDPRNTVDGKSSIKYEIPNLDIASTVSPKVIDYNQNAVLKIDASSDEGAVVKSAYLDLAEIGGPSNVSMDTSLMSHTIAVKDSVTAGDKKIGITLVDQYGNKHYGEATLAVKPRHVPGKSDFDWDEARIYFVMTDRFNNGNHRNDDPNGENYDKTNLETYHGGDFKGIINKLDYLEDLGINTLWISPIVDNIDFNQGAGMGIEQYGYHGYWTKDFEKIDEHLGSLEDFKALLDAAHERGIKIMLDIVINHAGYGMRETDVNTFNVTNYPTEAYREKFAGMFRDPGSSDLVRGDLNGLPDFRTEDPAVRDKLIEWQTAWINRAKTKRGNTIDYFRIDTVNNVDSTALKALKNSLTQINPSFKMIGEAFGADINQDGGQLRSGQMDSILDFSFKYSAVNFVNGQISNVETYLEEINDRIDNTATLGEFLSSHDENGFLTRLEGTEAEKLAKLKAAAALQITAKGQPVIYYGEELGASGRNANNMGQPDGNLSENRYDMPWDRLNNPVYKSVYEHYKKLLKIRKDYSKVFAKGTRKDILASDEKGLLVFERKYEGTSVVIGINVTDTAKEITISVPFAPGTAVRDEYSSKKYTVSRDGKVKIIVPASSKGGTVILASQKK